MKGTPDYFHLYCKEYDLEQAKLEKDIKEIFCKNNCHKLNITIDGILGEHDHTSQDAVIGKKWKSLFWQQETKSKVEKKVIKLFLLKFFDVFISISLILLFEYTCM